MGCRLPSSQWTQTVAHQHRVQGCSVRLLSETTETLLRPVQLQQHPQQRTLFSGGLFG